MTLTKREPEEYARYLLHHLNCERVGDITNFAEKIGLRVRELPLKSFDGALARVPNQLKGRIAVRSDIREPGRKVFTIAHEIGHFLLPGHGTSECHCTKDDINSFRAQVAREHETAANRFASELLLPTRTLYDIVNQRKATVTLAKEIANEYATSLTAAAIKCVDVTEEACALVWSVNNHIEWTHKNDSFWPFIPKSRLDQNSCAGRLFLDHSRPAVDGEVEGDVWLSLDDGKEMLTLWEDSLFLPYYNAVLSILTIEF